MITIFDTVLGSDTNTDADNADFIDEDDQIQEELSKYYPCIIWHFVQLTLAAFNILIKANDPTSGAWHCE